VASYLKIKVEQSTLSSPRPHAGIDLLLVDEVDETGQGNVMPPPDHDEGNSDAPTAVQE